MYLPYIEDAKLIKETASILDKIEMVSGIAGKGLYSNVIDPFSAFFDAATQGISLKDWLKQENARQIQKTMQNCIGDFHQCVLGSMKGWENLGRGQIVDVENKKRKIVAEIKNKYNTTKGNHKIEIYDDLESVLSMRNKGWISYYVEIIPQNKKTYDKPFVPSDHKNKARRPVNERIRVIDGKTFYSLASGDKNALKNLYLILPKVIKDIKGIALSDKFKSDFLELFHKAFD
ncbi:MAG: Eco47II family restriction endonuclease [Candidatus Peregrinibacteria bacterium]